MNQHQQNRQQLWINVATAVAGSATEWIPSLPADWANETLAAFDRAFPEPPPPEPKPHERTYPPKHPGKTCHLCGAKDYACEHVEGVDF